MLLAPSAAATASFLFFVRTVLVAAISFLVAVLPAGIAFFVFATALAGGAIGGATAIRAGTGVTTTFCFVFFLVFLRVFGRGGGEAKDGENERTT